MSDITLRSNSTGHFKLVLIFVPSIYFLDKCTQFITPTKFTVLIIYRYEKLISHMFLYSGTSLEGHKMPGLK